MNEDEVLENIVSYFVKQDWKTIYCANGTAKSSGGMDAALSNPTNDKFIIIEAKGEPKTAKDKSVGLTTLLGAILKRIKMSDGYGTKNTYEKINNFIPADGAKDIRLQLQKFGILQNCKYILAVPKSYADVIINSLDPEIAAMLNVHVYIVTTENICPLVWK
jgi:hypothetical protein